MSAAHGVCLLADGMGGRDFGEVASSLCVSTLNKCFKKYLPKSLKGLKLADGPTDAPLIATIFKPLVDTWIRDVNGMCWDFGTIDHKYREMGTTVALLYQAEDYIVVAHVGDSRVYRIRGDEIVQLTDDHSFVNSQLKANLITPEEAAMSSYKNIITRAIGTRSTVKAEVAVHPCAIGDLYVLCSDGLSDQVEDPEILATLDEQERDLESGVDALIDLANLRGGPDNITVILARVDAAEAAGAGTEAA